MCLGLACLRPLPADDERGAALAAAPAPPRSVAVAGGMADAVASRAPGTGKHELPLSFGAAEGAPPPPPSEAAARLPRSSAAARVQGMLAGLPLPAPLPTPRLIWDEFNVPRGEELQFDAACALKEHHLLLQGRLYVFQSRVAFFSSLFGVVHKKSLPFADITIIKRSTSRRVFGAIEIVSRGREYTFVSLWDAARALRALHAAWRASGSPYAALYLRGESDGPRAAAPTPPPSRQRMPPARRAEEAEHAVPARSESQRALPVAPAPPPADAASEGASPEHAEHMEGLLSAASAAPEPLLSPPAPLLRPEAAATTALPDIMPAACALRQPAPPPEGGQLLPIAADGADTEVQLDCSPCEFFALFLADGSRFTEAFRAARGESDIAVAPWADCTTHGGGNGGGDGDVAAAACVRTVTFRAPLDAMKGIHLPGIPKSTRIKEEQRCAFHDCHAAGEGAPQLIVLQSESAQLDIPYGDAFLLDARLELRAVRAAPPRTAASVHFRVRWLSPPFLSSIRHKIESQSTTSIGEAFRMMFEMAQSYLSRWQQLAASSPPRRRRSKWLTPGAATPSDAEVEPPPSPGGASVATTEEGDSEPESDEMDAAASALSIDGARVDALLSRLEPAAAAELRDALHLPALPTAAEPCLPALKPEDAAAAGPRGRGESRVAAAADVRRMLRQQALLASGPVAFGAVVDALQQLQRSVPPAASVRRRAARWLALLPLAALLAAMLLLAAVWEAGVRYGRRASLAAQHICAAVNA